jgi:dihydrofolate reductase
LPQRSSMRKIVVTEFVSLDGVFEAPGPDGSDYKYAGWTFAYFNEEFGKFKTEELMAADAQLLGRVTYEGFAKAWPERTGDEFSDKFNSMSKYVVSKTLKKADWNNSHIIKGSAAKEIAKLKESKGKNILVSGSGKLVNFLLEEKLVDEIRLLVYPIILGTGRQLFKSYSKLKLIESTPFKTGVLALRYEPIQK